jgi:uridylate kinase
MMIKYQFSFIRESKQWYWHMIPSLEKLGIVVGGGRLSRGYRQDEW